MDIQVVQSLTLVGLFLSMVLFVMLPFKLVGKDHMIVSTLPSKYDKIISLANCLSGGVFLATFFVGLLPEVRREMNIILKDAQITSSMPITEVVVLFGFFLAMFVEQCALTVKEKEKDNKNVIEKDEVLHHRRIRKIPSNGVQFELPLDENTALVSSNDEDLDAGDLFGDEVLMDEREASHKMHHYSAPVFNSRKCQSSQLSSNHIESHGHSHDVDALLQSSSTLRFVILVMSLGVHSLFEGMALGLQTEIHTLLNLFVGVWLHECLIAFALGFSLLKLNLSLCRSWQIAVLFSSLIPFGQFIGIIIGNSKSWMNHIASTVLQAVAAGTFIQVTFLDIIPEGIGIIDNYKMLKVLLLFLGFLSIVAVTALVTLQGSS